MTEKSLIPVSQGQEIWGISFQSGSDDNIFSTACYDAVRIFDIRHQPSNPSHWHTNLFICTFHFISFNPEPVLEIAMSVIMLNSATFSPSYPNEIAIACDIGIAVQDIRQPSHPYE